MDIREFLAGGKVAELLGLRIQAKEPGIFRSYPEGTVLSFTDLPDPSSLEGSAISRRIIFIEIRITTGIVVDPAKERAYPDTHVPVFKKRIDRIVRKGVGIKKVTGQVFATVILQVIDI